MINKNVESALNDQLNAEFFSSYFYLSMAAYFETQDLPGMSSFFSQHGRMSRMMI